MIKFTHLELSFSVATTDCLALLLLLSPTALHTAPACLALRFPRQREEHLVAAVEGQEVPLHAPAPDAGLGAQVGNQVLVRLDGLALWRAAVREGAVEDAALWFVCFVMRKMNE